MDQTCRSIVVSCLGQKPVDCEAEICPVVKGSNIDILWSRPTKHLLPFSRIYCRPGRQKFSSWICRMGSKRHTGYDIAHHCGIGFELARRWFQLRDPSFYEYVQYGPSCHRGPSWIWTQDSVQWRQKSEWHIHPFSSQNSVCDLLLVHESSIGNPFLVSVGWIRCTDCSEAVCVYV